MTLRSPARGPGRRHATLLAAAMLLVASLKGAAAGADAPGSEKGAARDGLFARDNLVAWCIVPFDSRKRSPEQRAAMLERLGFRRFAYDWRAEHVPTFDAELDALKRHGIKLQAFWLAPGELNADAQRILDLLKRHEVRTELWVILNLGNDRAEGAEQARRVEAAAAKLRPLAEAAGAIGCTIGLYNHGGWFGEPENQLEIIDRLKRDGVSNVGIVYNLHHGHAHLDRLAPLLAKIRPHLLAVNLNGMERDGESTGRKILPLGQGPNDLELLRIIEASGYRGPIGILGHTMDDAEERLRDNLDGLDWLVAQLHSRPAGPRPSPRTPMPKKASSAAATAPAADPAAYDAERVARLVADARASGDPQRGADVFLSAQFGCASCHALGQASIQGHGHGANTPAPVGVGPALATVGKELSPEQIVESILWPRRQVKEGYSAVVVATADGKQVQGYRQSETPAELVLREAATGAPVRIAKVDVEEIREQGTLMPEGLARAMSDRQRTDLVRFLMELGHADHATTERWLSHSHGPASFPYSREPLRPELWPNWQAPVNRDRVYDFYAKEADYFGKQPKVPMLLPPYPGLDGGRDGHWGNQNDDTWVDSRWNETDVGPIVSGVFRGAGVTVPKAVCVRLGEHGEMAACFNPETLCYEALWKDGFVRYSSKRHGFLDGLSLAGTPLERPEGKKPGVPFVYRGFYRHGKRVVFAYRIGQTEMLDAPWAEDGRFTRIVAPASEHPLAALTRGGPAQWPQEIATRGKLGAGGPYAIDTIEPPFKNPWNALMFFGDHDFLPDGSALLCTMQGEVWRARGLDAKLESVHWRRFATGLHEALGLVVADGRVYVQGRDQITRLHDLNGDGEADFYECVNNAYTTSPAGHDFISGLQRDRAGNFYTVSGNQGLLKLTPDGRAEVLATGFRNPDGLGLSLDGTITVPCSEGDWTPASMICAIKPGGFYGHRGPKKNQPPDLPMVYLPRGLDNSSGGQATVTSDRWGPLEGQLLHFSFGMGTHFLVLRDQVDGQPQGAVVPLPGDFLSGAHRGRFNSRDGQLYVSGLAGWGTYTPLDGCFQRVRYTGEKVQLPVEFHACENGVLVKFSSPVDRAVAGQAKNQFAQVWNYRYGSAYGSPEYSPRHPGMPGHDPLEVRSAWVLDDGRTVFLELPELQPVSQLHLHVKVDAGPPLDLFATVHKLAEPYRDFPGYTPAAKTIAAHPILSDLALATRAVPNRWRRQIRNAREINIQAGKNLTYTVSSFEVKPGEPIRINFGNPDVVPHNWVLIRQGSLPRVGEVVNKLVADPEAAARHYIPRTDDVLAATDMVFPQGQTSIYFVAPTEKGRYPFLCSFPGHWMIMNGVMIVK